MDWLQFISSIIGSLAWPAAVMNLVLNLQAPLRNLLRDLSQFRYKEIEIDFGKEILVEMPGGGYGGPTYAR